MAALLGERWLAVWGEPSLHWAHAPERPQTSYYNTRPELLLQPALTQLCSLTKITCSSCLPLNYWTISNTSFDFWVWCLSHFDLMYPIWNWKYWIQSCKPAYCTANCSSKYSVLAQILRANSKLLCIRRRILHLVVVDHWRLHGWLTADSFRSVISRKMTPLSRLLFALTSITVLMLVCLCLLIRAEKLDSCYQGRINTDGTGHLSSVLDDQPLLLT